MDFTSEILARLQKGESVDSLAAELTKAINDAHAENERIKAAAEAKRQAERKAQDKYNAVDDLLRALESIIAAWDLGDDMLDLVGEIDTDEMVQEFDEAIPAAKAYAEIMEKIGTARKTPAGDHSMKAVPDLPAVNDPIEDFLNKFVR